MEKIQRKFKENSDYICNIVELLLSLQHCLIKQLKTLLSPQNMPTQITSENISTSIKTDNYQADNSSKFGLVLPFLCAIHCIALPFLVSLLPFLGQSFFSSEIFEWLMLLVGACTSAYLLTRDRRIHKQFSPIILALLGFGILSLGHILHEIPNAEFISIALGCTSLLFAYILNWNFIKKMKNCIC